MSKTKIPKDGSVTDGSASHITGAGTRKYQANGPLLWGPIFRRVANAVGGAGAAEGIGIRAVLAMAVSMPIEQLVKHATETMGKRTGAVALVPTKATKATKEAAAVAAVEAKQAKRAGKPAAVKAGKPGPAALAAKLVATAPKSCCVLAAKMGSKKCPICRKPHGLPVESTTDDHYWTAETGWLTGVPRKGTKAAIAPAVKA